VEHDRQATVDEVARLFRAVLAPGWARGPRGFGRQLPEPLQDMTMAQLRALMVLSHEQPLAIGALAERLGTGLPAASRLVERLVADALVERYEDPTDRRRALVRLSTRGQSALDETQQGRRQGGHRLRSLLARLPADRLDSLRAVMADLAALSKDEGAAESVAGAAVVAAAAPGDR
jgi:DNA-binding MarR family transcriptional regulator